MHMSVPLLKKYSGMLKIIYKHLTEDFVLGFYLKTGTVAKFAEH